VSRRTVSVLVVCAAILVVLWLAADVLLVVFAGILFAVFVRGGGDVIAARAHVARGIGLAIFGISFVAAAAAFLAFAGAAFADQLQKLVDSLPQAIQAVRSYVEAHGWMRRALDMFDPGDFMPSGRLATSAFSTTFGLIGNVVVIAFVGLYGAISPGIYARGLTALLAPSLRPTASDMLDEAASALRGWLMAQLVSMTAVGVLTGLGLWALGVPLALILAVLAALLTFIPNIGPILAATPAVLLGLSDGLSTALWIAGLYVAVQTIESYVITPGMQKETVSLPPALTISMQLLFGVLFGILGLALATPLAAVLLRVLRKFYVAGYLDREAAAGSTDGGHQPPERLAGSADRPSATWGA
jgi:predicted PurR-regulated permease PerM